LRAAFDVIVIGGGHAGVEAAAAAARLGVETLLISPDLERLGQMSCNPAIGGVAKGVVAREVDALGGIMGRATDATRIHFRMLNRSKGPAVWGPRAQCDRSRYPVVVRRLLQELPGLALFQDLVSGLEMEGGAVAGVRTRSGHTFLAPSVVVTAGTFLRGRIHVGGEGSVGAGRAGEAPSVALAEVLEAGGLQVERFKTGTPPRVDGRSVDFSRLEEQPGDEEDYRFSAYVRENRLGSRPCWITRTSEALTRVIETHLHRSALYGGEISGRGPRYCPSIEDKVVRFPQARGHQVFLEPEGMESSELYVNGLSTSLPAEVQVEFLRTVPGLEEARITRMGYAIEYDYFPPTQLRHTLEARDVPGLFLAGQVNGTTGYEEAAGQGVVAGVNAGLRTRGEAPLILGRDQAYIGILIDDLVTRGVDEPYRLFTSRAEFRLLLRQDNAVERLAPLARARGLLTPQQSEAWETREERAAGLRRWFQGTGFTAEEVNPTLRSIPSATVEGVVRAEELLRRPEVKGAALLALDRENGGEWEAELVQAVEVEVKYEGYVRRERERAARVRAQAGVQLPRDLPYPDLHTLSMEAREKLDRIRPEDLSQAGRIPGVTPADLQNLLMEVRRWRRDRGRGGGVRNEEGPGPKAG
jgi:tRNA uridine 5-carboxymethylaminomethyl modification enzyme